jgi:hypothetical protein
MDPTILKELQEMEKNNDFDNPIQRTTFQNIQNTFEKAVGRMARIH